MPIPRFRGFDKASGKPIPPFPKGWSDFDKTPPTEEQLRKWDWAPDADIAVLTGYNGLVAVDLDSDAPEHAKALLAALPHANVARFGSKGFCLLMRHESLGEIGTLILTTGERPKTQTILEFKSKGSNITVPPSIHAKTGKPYYWFNPRTGEHTDIIPDIGDLPLLTDKQISEVVEAFTPWLTPKKNLKPKDRSTAVGEQSDKRLAAWAKSAIEGIEHDLAAVQSGRNNALNAAAYKISWAVREGYLSEAEVFNALRSACYSNGLVNDDGLSSVEATIESGLKDGYDKCEVPILEDRPSSGGNGGERPPPPEGPPEGETVKPRGRKPGHLKVAGGTDYEEPKPTEQNPAIDSEDFDADENGKRYKTFRNFKVALNLMKVKLRHNLFSKSDEFVGFKFYDGDMADRGVNQLWLAILNQYQIKYPERDFAIYVEGVADEDRYHPVRDYFDGLKWDGTPRLNKMLVTYWGADDTLANEFIGRSFMVAAVRRAKRAPVKFDNIMVLEGEQGKLKSTSLKTLCHNHAWFTDSFALKKSDPRDVIYQTRGKLIVEIAELTGIKNPEKIEHIKNLLSRDTDHTDLKWERRANDHHRQFVFAATTNYDTYLQDEKNRRFWPVECKGEIDIAAIERDRDQLWAEAIALEASGTKIYAQSHEKELLAELLALQEGRKIDDAWDEVIHPWLAGNHSVHKVTVRDIWKHCFDVPLDRMKAPEEKRIKDSLIRAGWKYSRSGGKKGWVRSKAVLPCARKCAPNDEDEGTPDDPF